MTPGLQELNCLASYLGCHPVGTILGLGQGWPQTRENLSLQGIKSHGERCLISLIPSASILNQTPHPVFPTQTPHSRLPSADSPIRFSQPRLPKLFTIQSESRSPVASLGPLIAALSVFQINYYADVIYTSVGVDPTQSQYVTVGSGVINLVMTIVSVSYWRAASLLLQGLQTAP